MDLNVSVLPYRKSASGIATYTLEIVKALASYNIKVHLIAYGLTDDQINKLEKLGVNVISISPKDPTGIDLLGPLAAYMFLSKRLQRLLTEKSLLMRIDLLHFTMPPASILFNIDAPIIVTAWVPLGFKEDMEKNFRSFRFPWNFLSGLATIGGRIADGIAYRKANRIVCTTEEVLKYVGSRYPGKVAYIRPPIEIKDALQYIRKDSDRDTVSILYVARDLEMPRKNVSMLLRSLQLVSKMGVRRFRVILVGRYSERVDALVRSISERTGIDIRLIRFLPRENLSSIYCGSDVFVYPSFYEELGYALLEAMSFGLPVVATDIPVFREITENGRNGFLVPVNDYRKMATALRTLIENEDLRKKLSMESLRIVREKYSWKAVAPNLVKLYQDVLRDRKF